VARFEGTALRGLLPVQYALVKNLPQRVFDAHLALRGLLEKDAKHLYVKTCQGFKSYGHKFYDVKYVEGSKKRTIDRLLGLGPQGLLILDDKTSDVVHDWPLAQIVSWGSSASFIFLRIAHPDIPNVLMEYHFGTNKAEEISLGLTRHAKNLSEAKSAVDSDVGFDFNGSPRCPPDPLLGNLSAKTSSTTSILSKFDGKQLVTIPEELSRQMSLIEQDYLRKISLVDCLNYALKKNLTSPGVEMIKKLIRHFNMVSDWVSSELVQEERDEDRLKILRNFIQLARVSSLISWLKKGKC